MHLNHPETKPFSITGIQAYAPTRNTEEAEVEQFYEDLQDLLELTPKKDVWDQELTVAQIMNFLLPNSG